MRVDDFVRCMRQRDNLNHCSYCCRIKRSKPEIVAVSPTYVFHQWFLTAPWLILVAYYLWHALDLGLLFGLLLIFVASYLSLSAICSIWDSRSVSPDYPNTSPQISLVSHPTCLSPSSSAATLAWLPVTAIRRKRPRPRGGILLPVAASWYCSVSSGSSSFSDPEMDTPARTLSGLHLLGAKSGRASCPGEPTFPSTLIRAKRDGRGWAAGSRRRSLCSRHRRHRHHRRSCDRSHQGRLQQPQCWRIGRRTPGKIWGTHYSTCRRAIYASHGDVPYSSEKWSSGITLTK